VHIHDAALEAYLMWIASRIGETDTQLSAQLIESWGQEIGMSSIMSPDLNSHFQNQKHKQKLLVLLLELKTMTPPDNDPEYLNFNNLPVLGKAYLLYSLYKYSIDDFIALIQG
jgi:hypothetical protein